MNGKRTESPVYARQWSGGSSNTGSSSPVGSPAHPRSRLPPAMADMSTIMRTQNVAAKAASQRLMLVMALKTPNDEEDDDMGFRFGPRLRCRVTIVPVGVTIAIAALVCPGVLSPGRIDRRRL